MADPVDVPGHEIDMHSMITTIAAAATASGWTSPVVPWPGPLPDQLGLVDVLELTGPSGDGDTVVVGLADHPEGQVQIPFVLHR